MEPNLLQMKFFRIVKGSLSMLNRETVKGIVTIIRSSEEFSEVYKESMRYDLEGTCKYCCTKKVFEAICYDNVLSIYDEELSRIHEKRLCRLCNEKDCNSRPKNCSYLEAGKHYLIISDKEPEPSLVYCYMYEGKKVIGFNCAQGGLKIEVEKLLPDVKTYEMAIIKV